MIVSFWSLAYKWTDNLSYYIESKISNYLLSEKYQDLAYNESLLVEEWRQEKKVLDAMGELRKIRDLYYDLTDEEKRMGMHAALRNFKRACAGCENIPTSMTPIDCGICGQCKHRSLKWLM